MVDFTKLAEPFNPSDIHWRPQGKVHNGASMALAYLDARDIMGRLDEVCGVDGWKVSYVETPSKRVIGTISIRIEGGEWVGKSDGAGDTAVEGEKGGISAALKRAAVVWGIGRYLYDMPTVWVPCEEKRNGGWKRWTSDPWSCVKGFSAQSKVPEFDPKSVAERILKSIPKLNKLDLTQLWQDEQATLVQVKAADVKVYDEIYAAFGARGKKFLEGK